MDEAIGNNVFIWTESNSDLGDSAGPSVDTRSFLRDPAWHAPEAGQFIPPEQVNSGWGSSPEVLVLDARDKAA